MAHYLVTGHTGFKGSWLTLLLKAKGHKVSGIALDPPQESLFERAKISQDLAHDVRIDVRNREAVIQAFGEIKPDFVIHMAAQALVLEGYRNPRETYEINVNGTLNVLEASEISASVRAQIIVTTDKVYENRGLNRPYVESDPLGGNDPYSASKAMADILAQEHLARKGATPGAVVRAGNVVGAGDYSRGRLIPDFVRANQVGAKLTVRHPEATRPWQHVLDCLGGYLLLLDAVDSRGFRGQWNFGPPASQTLTVKEVLEICKRFLPKSTAFASSGPTGVVENRHLSLNSSKSLTMLGWHNRYLIEDTIRMALEEITLESDLQVRDIVLGQLRNFLANSP